MEHAEDLIEKNGYFRAGNANGGGSEKFVG
jgi:hypothetical protein